MLRVSSKRMKRIDTPNPSPDTNNVKKNATTRTRGRVVAKL